MFNKPPSAPPVGNLKAVFAKNNFAKVSEPDGMVWEIVYRPLLGDRKGI